MSISAHKTALIVLALYCSTDLLSAQTAYGERQSSSGTNRSSSADKNVAYIEKYNEAAVREMTDYGIPASITLAQGLLESAAGTSTLATIANNHFGIKCGDEWDGETYYKVDDDLDRNGNVKRSCFRKYESAQESFADHSEFLAGQRKEQRYGFLFTRLGPTDYKNWARGLQSAGYATAKDYADNLITLIERYNLQQYDKEDYREAEDTEEEADYIDISDRILFVNDVAFVHTRKNESIESIAEQLEVSPDDLAIYNDSRYRTTEKLENGTIVFLSEKKVQWDGTEKYHTVEESETMFYIAQQYGIKLSSLMSRNGLKKGQEPEEGERIYIRSQTNAAGDIRIRTETKRETATKPAANTKPAPRKNPDELDFEITPGNNEQGTGYQKRTSVSDTEDEPDDNDNRDGYHLVKKGDTLYSISRKYKTTVEKLKRLNNMRGDAINTGEWLKVK
jgi:flagellum-specific peptidoglycan hydrolase FlgJ/LysM repeat protein